ncbi:hypothetical protein ASPWEDRAFT_293677 [Aspergillus wentii DTO 134E9]|uniref:Uncharacterized protein n=1 Tax=Aspergillus wentii DTO 134E9 TaxID=1073089 RepID=A0A1L9S446_ASPWE|nr:uncharacterized protein ASPWEDRAFT_293677 [Aspergillus wentii DTO 134E9]OJJ41930.1 hypothetical protein ASPWEDRAFT_293677 [Aspergillus wentii DTO 134E9]
MTLTARYQKPVSSLTSKALVFLWAHHSTLVSQPRHLFPPKLSVLQYHRQQSWPAMHRHFLPAPFPWPLLLVVRGIVVQQLRGLFHQAECCLRGGIRSNRPRGLPC